MATDCPEGSGRPPTTLLSTAPCQSRLSLYGSGRAEKWGRAWMFTRAAPQSLFGLSDNRV